MDSHTAGLFGMAALTPVVGALGVAYVRETIKGGKAAAQAVKTSRTAAFQEGYAQQKREH
jgi:hypothetical protein